jgi:hypothetical protein
MRWTLTERTYNAHRLHQFRIEARLTPRQVDERAALKAGRCFAIEYRGAGTVKEIKRILALFVPGERRMRGKEEVTI